MIFSRCLFHSILWKTKKETKNENASISIAQQETLQNLHLKKRQIEGSFAFGEKTASFVLCWPIEMEEAMRRAKRSSNHPLHNFTLPPTLKWGNQRFLRCMKLQPPPPSDHHQSLAIPDQRFKSKPINDNSTPTTMARKKLTFDHRIVEKLKAAILEEEEQEQEGGGNDACSRPWNLRKRRAAAACKEPQMKEEEERVKLSVSLLKEEVEEDFTVMVGTRPPRRPKKRPRLLQKQLDSLFPGVWLTEVTPDLYKVAE